MADERIVEQCAVAPLRAEATLANLDRRPVAECDEKCSLILSPHMPLELRFRDSADTHRTGDALRHCDSYDGSKPVAPKVLAAQEVDAALPPLVRAMGGRRGARLCAGRQLAGLAQAGSVGRAAAVQAAGDAAVLPVRRHARASGARAAPAEIPGACARSSRLAPSHPLHPILISRYRNGTAPIAGDLSS